MLTLKECRKLVDVREEYYTDEELKLMLEFLTELAASVVTNLKEQADEEESSNNVASIQR